MLACGITKSCKSCKLFAPHHCNDHCRPGRRHTTAKRKNGIASLQGRYSDECLDVASLQLQNRLEMLRHGNDRFYIILLQGLCPCLLSAS